jgi:hypothetical protein
VRPTCQRAEERERIPVRGGVFLGCGLVLLLGRKGSLGPFSIFIFFSSFLFLISYFLYRFCTNAPNQIKPLSGILQNSQQGFKPIGSKFLETKQDF